MGISNKIWSLQFMSWFLGNRMMQCSFGRHGSGGGEGGALKQEMKRKTTRIIKISKRRRRSKSKRMIKVIKAEDGVVNIYRNKKGIQVSEVVMEFPKHMICKSDSFYIGQMIPPLSNNYRLQHGQTYFLLPNHLFQSALSFLTLTSFIASAKSQSHIKTFLNSQSPFHIQKTPSGYLKVNVSQDFISQMMIVNEEEAPPPPKNPLCTTHQLQKDYTHLVTPRIWKPKLETIKEKKETHSSSSSSSSMSVSVSKNKMKIFLAKRRKRKHSSTITSHGF